MRGDRRFVCRGGRSLRIALVFALALLAPSVFAQSFGPVLDLPTQPIWSGFGFSAGFRSTQDFSWSISAAGDVNGDGVGDFIIGDPRGSNNGWDRSGSAYVVFGRGRGFPAGLSLTNLNGSDGFRIDGRFNVDRAGIAVSGAGDINDDGYDDVLVGAHTANVHKDNNPGSAYVVFGRATPFAAIIDFGTMSASEGFELHGEAPNALTGNSVSNIGDFNGDGIDDFVVGAPQAPVGGVGYVVFGHAGAFPAVLDLSSLNGSNGFRLTGAGGEQAGYAVSSAGDINEDGLADVIIGTNETGRAYVVFGSASAFPASVALSTINGSNGFVVSDTAEDSRLGAAISEARDVNADGVDDIIVGAPRASAGGPLRGAAYVIYGKTTPFVSPLEMATLDGSNGFRMNGVVDQEGAGTYVGTAGDLNDDSFDDVVVGSRNFPQPSSVLNAYVVFGANSGIPPTLALSGLDGDNGVRIQSNGETTPIARSIAGGADLNGDGIDDLILGASFGAVMVLGRSSTIIYFDGFE